MNKRGAYLTFQALITVVLLLLFLYQKQPSDNWHSHFIFLAILLGALLIILIRVPQDWFNRSSLQGSLFISDVLLSTLTLQWVHQPESDLYLTYFLVIFGTALTQSMLQSFLVAVLATVLYGYSALKSASQVPMDAAFWLRLPYLWIVASFTAMQSRDIRTAQDHQEEIYQSRLFHMERLAVLGQISAEIAHRIKAPLTTIRVNAEVLAHQPDMPAPMQRELIQIQQEVDHCKDILQKLLNLGRIEEMDFQSMDLAEVVRSAIAKMKPQTERQRIEVQSSGVDDSLPMRGDPVLLSEALLSLMQNAVEAMPAGGTLQVALARPRDRGWAGFRRARPSSAEIIIADNGAGINREILETIFQPFFTTKPGQGHGLGLSAALRIIDKHGGSIAVASDGPATGAQFTITLPLGGNPPGVRRK